jgi:hypothetical protein
LKRFCFFLKDRYDKRFEQQFKLLNKKKTSTFDVEKYVWMQDRIGAKETTTLS